MFDRLDVDQLKKFEGKLKNLEEFLRNLIRMMDIISKANLTKEKDENIERTARALKAIINGLKKERDSLKSEVNKRSKYFKIIDSLVEKLERINDLFSQGIIKKGNDPLRNWTTNTSLKKVLNESISQVIEMTAIVHKRDELLMQALG